jgi:hypothetical protein
MARTVHGVVRRLSMCDPQIGVRNLTRRYDQIQSSIKLAWQL